MMKTRRKSKAAAAVTHSPDSDGHDDFPLTIPDDIDLDALSEIFPDTDFSSPSQDAIIWLYRHVLAQALEVRSVGQELDETKAELDRKDVELDQALQDKETVSRDLEAQLESTGKELSEVRQERDDLVASRTALQSQITALSDSKTTSSSELDTLKHQLEDTEREKRDLVGLISRLKEESAQQEEEIHTLRANLKEARQEHQSLEALSRDLRSTETSTKFKIESLEQQLQLSQAEVERTNKELASKTEEFSKYRRTKHAEVTTLQASVDSLTQTHNGLQASFKSLQSNYNNQARQLTEQLTKAHDLTSQLAEQEAAFASEANGLRRLVAMMEEREKQAKDIVDGIEKEWAEVGEKAERREAALKAEAERERNGREMAEKRAEQLEGVLNRMGRGELPVPVPGTPGTPLRTPGTSDAMAEAMMGLSPTVAMASKAQKAGKTFTEVYADYVRLQDQYAKKCAEYDHMDRTLASVLGQIEERAPILSQQRAEYERLHAEASQLGSQLAQALAERDNQANVAADNAQKLSKCVKENELLQKQLEDLGRQVQGLLREIGRRDDPTIPTNEDLDTMAIAPAEDTEAVITNNLVLFRSIGGLQEQNQKLLKIVRELGKKMEADEKEYKETIEQEQVEAIKEAHEAIQEMAAQMERQKKNNETIVQAYVKERDALRAMLARAEKAGRLSNISSVPDQSTSDTSRAETEKELAEVQLQFEAFRKEIGIDSDKLRDDLSNAQREIGSLTALLAKSNAKVELSTERHRMDQDQLAMHSRELENLQNRNSQLYDQWTRADIECTRVAEDLQLATGKLEQLRNESANLRAEKQIWETTEARLVDENKSLRKERSHLSDLMANVQKMHNDLERSGENDRRRLESQLKMLEDQGQDLRTQLSQERDNIRHLNLQKEIEHKEFQGRFEKMVQEFSKTREDLVGAQTSKKHLEERVDDLARQLKGNHEKLVVYERRAPGAASTTTNASLNDEQQLEIEVAELRSALKVAEHDLATARSHVQQFQEISQANEQALASLNVTYDEYKTSTEAQITRHESEHQALQEKLRAIREELVALATKNNGLEETLESERVAWTKDKRTLEGMIADLGTSEKHSENDRAAREQEVRLQEGRAKAAEERYANEVLAHADSIKTIESLRHDVAAAQTSARDNLTAAEAAKANLTASEASWQQQKDALNKEMADVNARCKDLTSQNSILHQHLESVSSQANRIRAAASSTSTVVDTDASGDVDSKLSELRSVVTYLRKEKEIVDLQHELSKQTIARQKGEIDRLTKDLADTRQALSEEREKALETATSATQHAELLERINQLNILRESNITLRAESENHAKKSRELEVKLKQLSQELDPAKEQARMAQAELDVCKAHITRLEEESRRWQERNIQLLSKYDRADPAEAQGLRDEIEQLKSQKVELEKQKIEVEQVNVERQSVIETQTTKIANLEKNLQNLKEHSSKNLSIFKNKIGKAESDIKTLTEENQALKLKIVDLDKAVTAAQAAEQRALDTEEVQQQTAKLAALAQERDALLAEKATWIQQTPMSTDSPSVEERTRWETERVNLERARDEALAKAKVATEEAQKAADEARDMKLQSEKFQARITSMMKAKAAEESKQGGGVSEDARKQYEDELRALQARLSAKEEEFKAEIEAARRDAHDSSSDKDVGAKILAAVEKQKKELQVKHGAEIEAAIERGRMEQMAKSKLKDSQLVKAQKRVKELEGQIHEWRTAGLVPDAPPATPATTVPAASANSTSATTSGSAAPPIRTGPALPSNPAALGRKPSLGAPTGPAATAGVGRGAGASRGRVLQRAVGGAVGPGRAAPPTHNAQGGSGSAPTTVTGGMSIMGAAAKRPREGETPDDSLTKRLKPGEAGPSKPVMLRRPQGGPPS